MKVVLYLRISTPEKNTLVQRQICEHYIHEKGYDVVQIIDENRSGYKNLHLRKLFSFLQNLENEQPFDKLIVYSYDRFSRNIVDGLEMVRRLDEFGIKLESVVDNIDYCTPDGRKRLAEKFILTQYESDINSFRSKAAKLFPREFNLRFHPPYGQRVEPVKQDKYIVDDKESKILEFIRSAKQGGLTSDELTDMMWNIGDLDDGDRIGIVDEDGDVQDPARPMSYGEISQILNSCGVKKRKRSWTPVEVARVSKRSN